jgi:hypothetical protein
MTQHAADSDLRLSAANSDIGRRPQGLKHNALGPAVGLNPDENVLPERATQLEVAARATQPIAAVATQRAVAETAADPEPLPGLRLLRVSRRGDELPSCSPRWPPRTTSGDRISSLLWASGRRRQELLTTPQPAAGSGFRRFSGSGPPAESRF